MGCERDCVVGPWSAWGVCTPVDCSTNPPPVTAGESYFDIWRPPSLNELTPMISNTGLTHLGLEASNCKISVRC